MPKFKIKGSEEKDITVETRPKNDGVDNRLELVKYTAQVQSRISDNITSDFVLAKLDEQNRQGITEMTVNAYLAMRQISGVIAKATRWHFIKGQWVLKREEQKTIIKIKQIKEKVFDTFMTKVTMVAVLFRNVDKNYLVEVLSGIKREEQEETILQDQNEGVTTKLKRKFSKKEQEENTM